MTRTEIDKKIINISVAVLITILITVATFAYQSGTHIQELKNEIKTLNMGQIHLVESYQQQIIRIGDLEKAGASREIELARINTKLANIETLLLEIKQDIKNN